MLYHVKFPYLGMLVAEPSQKSLSSAIKKAERLRGAVFDLQGNLIHMPKETIRTCVRSLGRDPASPYAAG